MGSSGVAYPKYLLPCTIACVVLLRCYGDVRPVMITLFKLTSLLFSAREFE